MYFNISNKKHIIASLQIMQNNKKENEELCKILCDIALFGEKLSNPKFEPNVCRQKCEAGLKRGVESKNTP